MLKILSDEYYSYSNSGIWLELRRSGIINIRYGNDFISAMLEYVLHASCRSSISLHKGCFQVQMSKLTLLSAPNLHILNRELISRIEWSQIQQDLSVLGRVRYLMRMENRCLEFALFG